MKTQNIQKTQRFAHPEKGYIIPRPRNYVPFIFSSYSLSFLQNHFPKKCFFSLFSLSI
jgi:hypothetical protein